MSESIDYPQRLEDALLWMVRSLLTEVARDGLPGEHHFYLTFQTDGEGVEIPATLRASYPEEMTIVLQHRYWDLEVDEERFGVTLSFDGRRQRLVVPFAALRAFLDPSVRFGLRFGPSADGTEDGEAEAAEGEAAEEAEAPAEGASPNKVVSLDDFRKR